MSPLLMYPIVLDFFQLIDNPQQQRILLRHVSTDHEERVDIVCTLRNTKNGTSIIRSAWEPISHSTSWIKSVKRREGLSDDDNRSRKRRSPALFRPLRTSGWSFSFFYLFN